MVKKVVKYKKKTSKEWPKMQPDVCADIFESARDAVIISDGRGKVSYWNKEAEKMFGYKKEQAIGRKLHSMIIPFRYRKMHLAGMEKFRKTGKGKLINQIYQTYALNKDKKEFPAELSLSRFFIRGGWHVLGIVRDITERVEAEKKRLAEKEKYETVLKTSIDGFWIVDLRGKIIDVNDAYCRISGYSRKELLKMRIADIEAVETSKEIIRQIKKIVRLGYGRFERKHRTKSGKIIDVDISATYLPEKEVFFTSLRDITEINKIREKINSVAKFPEENPYPVFRSDKNLAILYANKAGSHLLDKVKGRGGAKMRGQLLKILTKALRLGKTQIEEVKIENRTISFVVVPVKGEKYANFYGRDITDQKNAEQALINSDWRLKKSQEIAHLGSWELDLIENKLTWSDEVYRIFGLKSQQFSATYEAFLKLVHPSDRKAVDRAYSSSVREGRDTYEIEHRIVRPTGEIRVVREKCEHIRDKNGRIVRSLGMVHDITDRKRFEFLLQKKAEENRIILDSVPALVFYKDGNNRFLRVNKALENAAGLPKEKMEGKSLFDLYPKELAEAYWKDDLEVIKSAKAKIGIIETLKTSRGERTVQTDKIPYRDEKGNVIGVIGFSIDITERQKADKMKSEFVSIASHQLRTPLTAIRWIIERLNSGKIGEFSQEQKDYLNQVYDSNRRMIKLVDDLLSVSRLEEGKIRIEPKPLQLEEVIEDIIKNQKNLIDFCRCEVVFDKSKEKLDPILIDEILIRQVIHNLLTNAIRYSSSGGKVTVKLEKRPKDYLLTVADNGIGIPKDKQYRIFEKFFRADNAQKKQTEGTGLGLYISKMIVGLFGGKIWFESEENRGTAFYVSLPVKLSTLR